MEGSLEELDDEDQQDQACYALLQLVEAPYEEQTGGGLGSLRRVQLAYEELVESQGEDYEDGGDQVPVHRLDYGGNGTRSQLFSGCGPERQVGVLAKVPEKIEHVDRGEVKGAEGEQEAEDHRHEDEEAAAPQRLLE